MEAPYFSEMSLITLCQSTPCNIPEDLYQPLHHHENIKSQSCVISLNKLLASQELCVIHSHTRITLSHSIVCKFVDFYEDVAISSILTISAT